MRSTVIVVEGPDEERREAFLVAFVGLSIGPAVEHEPDEALGLAVRLGAIGPRVDV